jgi:hypothetical protein
MAEPTAAWLRAADEAEAARRKLLDSVDYQRGRYEECWRLLTEEGLSRQTIEGERADARGKLEAKGVKLNGW